MKLPGEGDRLKEGAEKFALFLLLLLLRHTQQRSLYWEPRAACSVRLLVIRAQSTVLKLKIDMKRITR
jgi:hypothetical protein